LTRAALGLTSLDEVPFCEATLFNFQRRLLEYELSTGTHLREQIFDNCTAEQQSTLRIKTDLQRCDSMQMESNIRTYSRIQLPIEVLLHTYHVQTDEDKKTFESLLKWNNWPGRTWRSAIPYRPDMEIRTSPAFSGGYLKSILRWQKAVSWSGHRKN
jgi:hypothetical protein